MMDKNPDKLNRSLLLYFALSIVFAALSILASRFITVTYFLSSAKITINLKWMFWLSATLSVAFILPLVRRLVFALYQQGRLPIVLGWFFRDEVVEKLASTIRFLQSSIISTVGRLCLAGLGIFFLTIAVWRSGIIHETETDSNLLTIVDAASGRHTEFKEAVFSTVELCSDPQSRDHSYRNRLRLVTDLKAAGVKVVVIGIHPFGSEDELPLIKKLEETGIVVFATDYGRTLRISDSTGELKLSAGCKTMSEREVEETYRLVRLRPAGMENVGSPRLLDVSMEVLRKYKGYKSDAAWSEEGGEFRFGDYRIPVTKDGWMYSRDRGFRIPLTLVYVDSTGTWLDKNDMPKFISPGMTKASLKIEGGIRGGKIPLQDPGNHLQGKIVVLMDSFVSSSSSYFVSIAYSSVIENILAGALIRKWELGHLWISLLFLVIAALITYRVRLLVAFLILLALLPLVLFLGSYLYTSHDILIDMFYPLLSTAMAIVVFPIVAMGKQYSSGREEF
jgi:hypothetical protein